MVRRNPWKLLKDTKAVPKEETVTQLEPLVWKLHEDRLKGDIRSYINKYRASDQKMFLLKFIGKFWKELQGFKNERSWYVCGRDRAPQYFVHVEIIFRALVYATVYLGVHFLLHSALIKFEINSQKNYIHSRHPRDYWFFERNRKRRRQKSSEMWCICARGKADVFKDDLEKVYFQIHGKKTQKYLNV